MPSMLHHRELRRLRSVVSGICLLAATAAPAAAQSTSLADAVFALWDQRTTVGNVRVVKGQLFGALVDFEVENGAHDAKTLQPTDRVTRFTIERSGTTLGFTGGTVQQFSDWVRANAQALKGYLFPTSVSESVSGKDAAQNHAQQFLFNIAMAVDAARQTNRPTRPGAGGLFEVEHLSGDGRSALAFQGLYRIERARMSLIGRYSQQQEGAPGASAAPLTRSLALATDFHPSLSLNQSVDWRVGVDARTGLLLTHASTIDFGSIDYGGGVWTSAQKDFSRLRVGVGSLVQGSRSYVPTSIDGDLEALAKRLNAQPIAWDVSYGAIGGFALTTLTSLNAKFLQTAPFSGQADQHPTTTILMGSVSRLIRGATPVDVGYKYTTTGGIRAHGVFVQGNYGW